MWRWSRTGAAGEYASWPEVPSAERELIDAVAVRARRLAAESPLKFSRAVADLADVPRDGAAREALVLASAAALRVLALEPYAPQLLAAWHLLAGAVCEMATGEGKSLAAAIAAAAFALQGRHVHVMTVNAYLAARDQVHFAPLFAACELSSALLVGDGAARDKQRAYRSAIVYGVGHDFGFDYLRDSLLEHGPARAPLGAAWLARANAYRGGPDAPLPRATLQTTRDVAIVDEVDSVLIDEARSALILRDAPRRPSSAAEPYRWASARARELLPALDYVASDGVPRLTVRGLARLSSATPPAQGLARPWPGLIENALRAEHLLIRDVDYLIADDEILLIDEATGRKLPGRAWQDGLHQAVEAKEKLTISAEARPLARIARQRYFQFYRTVCGLTGTANGLAHEFEEFYGVKVARIPLRTPSRRRVETTRWFRDRHAKFAAIALDVVQLRSTGRPVLIGTRTVRDSEQLAALLGAAAIECQVLNARQDAGEAAIVAAAGAPGAVTVATNMAGRGTDIHLAPQVVASGGLHVIGAEHFEEARLDRQLIGRAARQGDPGSAQFYVAAEDGLLRYYAPALSRRLARAAQTEVAGIAAREIVTAQRRAARKHTAMRQYLYAVDRDLQRLLSDLDAS